MDRNGVLILDITNLQYNMDMIKVDHELYVTCRLCLNEKGIYQIVPLVQEQIKYCFDIIVQSFDGLPQLICSKCKTILSDYFTIKKTFLEKQNAFKKRLEEDKENSSRHSILLSQNEAVTSTQLNDNEEKVNYHELSKTKRRCFFSSSSDDLDDDKTLPDGYHNTKTSNKSSLPNNKTKIRTVKKLDLASDKTICDWKKKYNLKFGCTLCNKTCPTKGSIKKHMNAHINLYKKYNQVLNKKCVVRLNKIDNLCNITGSYENIVHDKNKIVHYSGCNDFFMTFTRKEELVVKSPRAFSVQSKHHMKYTSDSSDDDIFIKKKQKRIRLLSKSSNETVVIDRDKSPASNGEDESNEHRDLVTGSPSECINIDDSSDSSSYRSSKEKRKEAVKNSHVADEKLDQMYTETIKNIVSMCQNKYFKKCNLDDNASKIKSFHTNSAYKSSLQRKILSIGRKVLKRPCPVLSTFNCAGLLRFMEHKNLKIKWLPVTSKEKNVVRLFTKLRSPDNSNACWKSINDADMIKIEKQDILKGIYSDISGESKTPIAEDVSNVTDSTEATENEVAVYSGKCSDHNSGSKLLNENPVANPKQLPKKIDVKSSKCPLSLPNLIDMDENYADLQNDEASDVCMPIITSTTSLAPNANDNDSNNSQLGDTRSSNANAEKQAPRIKVKPASELMSERVLNSMHQQQHVVNNFWEVHQIQQNTTYNQDDNRPPNAIVVNVFPVHTSDGSVHTSRGSVHTSGGPIHATSGPVHTTSGSSTMMASPQESLIQTQTNTASKTSSKEYVILDTVQMPNTKTDSPFGYFKDLLQMHKIILLDTHAPISRDFQSLIRFKLLFKQESKFVSLNLALLCLNNKFCLRIKDGNQEIVDINKLSANWQWEILKVYRSNITENLLNNAEKINQEIFVNTNNFICLLKSINFIVE